MHTKVCYDASYIMFRSRFRTVESLRTYLRYGSYIPSTGNPEGKTSKDNLKVDRG